MRAMSFSPSAARYAVFTAFVVALCFPHAVSAQVIRQVNLVARDITYDPVSRKIYASVGAGGNSVRSIDPFAETPVLGAPIPVGSNPGRLALSSNGQYLYVALDGVGAVRRVNLATQTAGLQFPVGAAGGATLYVEDMEVVPGRPDLVAISRQDPRFNPRHRGVVVYRDGVPLAKTVTGSNVLAFSDSPARLYGFTSERSEFTFRRMMVDDAGVVDIDATPGLLGGSGNDIEYDGGRIFTPSGVVIDPEARTSPGAFTGMGSPRAVEPITAVGRVFFVSLDAQRARYTLRAYDARTFALIDTVDLPGVLSAPINLIRWGTNGLAFNTGSAIFLIQTDLIPALPGPAIDLAAGSDNRTRHLMRYADDSAGIWTLGGAGALEGFVRFAPRPGWAPKALAVGGDSRPRLLWTATDGAAELWLLSPTNALEKWTRYGPYAGWSAIDVAADTAAGGARLLWKHTDGRMGLWTVSAAGGIVSSAAFGPYPGWTTRSLSVGADGRSRVLWNHTNGSAGLWLLGAAHTLESFVSYGPYIGWAATDLAAGAGDTTRLLWNRTNGSTGLWTVNATGSILNSATINPVVGWASNAITVGPDNNTRLSWNQSGGSVGWWRLSPSHVADAYLAYPPF